jgi:hypothetical protein
VFGELGIAAAFGSAGRCREYCGEIIPSAIRIYASRIGKSAYSYGAHLELFHGRGARLYVEALDTVHIVVIAD